MRISYLIPLLCGLAAHSLSAQITQLTRNPSVPFLPEEIAIQASAQSDGFPALVAWGSTAEVPGGAVRNVLYAQGVTPDGPIDDPHIITPDAAHPVDIVRVLPFYNAYLVLWYDDRSDGRGLYGQYVDVAGAPLSEEPERFGEGRVSRLMTVPNEDGTRLLIWSEGDRAEGRVLRLNRNGNRVGLVEGVGASVERVISFEYEEFDRFLVQGNGNAIPLRPDGTFDFAAVVPSGRLNQVALIGEDGDVWTAAGNAYYHFPDLWSIVSDDTLKMPDPERLGPVMLSNIDDEFYSAHHARIEFKKFRSFEYPTVRDSIWDLRLYTTVYHRTGEVSSVDSSVIYAFGKGYLRSGSTVHSHATYLIGTGFGYTECPPQRRASYKFHSVESVTDQLVRFDTTITFWGVDPWSGALVTDAPASCSVPADPVRIFRVGDPGSSTVQYRGFARYYNLRAPSSKHDSPESTWYLGLQRYQNQLFLLHNALPIEENNPEIGYGRSITLSRIDMSESPFLNESRRHYPLALPYQDRTFPERPHVFSQSWNKIEHKRVGPTSLIWRYSFRHDEFESTSSNDYPSYKAHVHDLSTLFGTDLKDVGGIFRDSASYQWNEPVFPSLTHVTWNPVREESIVSIGTRDAGYIVAVDSLGSIAWSFKRRSAINRGSRILSGASGEVLIVRAREMLRMNARGTEVVGEFSTLLDDVEIVQLYHNRFLRYGFDSVGGLLLETYTLELEPLQSLRIADSTATNLRLLLADDHGDSALVILTTEGAEIVVRTMNQSLEGLHTDRFTAVPDSTHRIDDLYGAFLNDTLVIAWVGTNIFTRDNEIYTIGLPVPEVVEEKSIGGGGVGSVRRADEVWRLLDLW